VLETVRRGFGHWAVNFTTMFEDYVAGIGLLVAAVATLRGAAWARTWMVIMWSGVMFMMLISTVSQVEKQLTGELEPRSGVVLVVKVLLWLASAWALWSAVRAAKPSRGIQV
jgi:hypothetical protein